MRLSSFVSLVVVTASFALGGCAADAEPSSGETQPNVALTDPNANAGPHDKTQDVGQTGKVSDQYANPADEQRARIVEHYVGGQVDPRIVITPSGFDAIPQNTAREVGEQLPVFHTVSPLGVGIKEVPGYTPYSYDKKNP
jgi:hypothetical protein